MTFAIAYYCFEWIIRIVALWVVPLRRTPAAARGWLLMIFFLPIAGLLLLLAIGRPWFPAWRRARFQLLLPYFADVAKRLDAPSNGLSSEADEVESLTRTLGHWPAVGGNSIELLDDYEVVIERLIRDIDAAEVHVRILVYLFANDAVGERVLASLARARDRGVAVQVIIDPVGSRPWIKGTLKGLKAAGADTRLALPFRWLHGRTRRDMRNHRKLFLIDGRIGYAGSQNIVAKDFRPGVVNRELVVRATGPIVAEMDAVFCGDWSLEGGTPPVASDSMPMPMPTGTARAQLLPSGADYPLEGFETLLVWQLHRAEHRVRIVTPYFVPDDDLVGAMTTAAARGVSIDLVVSSVVDQRLVNLAQASYYDELLTAGVRIHLYRDHLLHAKNVAIDGRLGIIGSSNVDLRSFQLNEEVSLLLLDTDSIASLERVQLGYLQTSDEVLLTAWRGRRPLRKVIENIARLLGSLL